MFCVVFVFLFFFFISLDDLSSSYTWCILISFVSGTRVETPKENAKGVVLENVM